MYQKIDWRDASNGCRSFPLECRLRHRLKFEFHAKQPNGSEFSVEMTLGHLDQGSHHTGPHSSYQLVLADNSDL